MDSDTRARLFAEYSELQQRVIKLREFISGQVFPTLNETDQFDLRAQLRAMTQYEAVLSRRVSRQGNAA